MNIEDKFKNLNKALAPSIEIEGKNYLYFGGTAYLGIPQNTSFIKLFIEGIKKYGLNNGTSRGNNVQLGIYNEFEAFTASKYGTESALVSSSGYLAAKLTVAHFANRGTLRYAPATHPSLWINGDPGVQGTFTQWTEDLLREINQSKQQKWVLVSNSINNLWPEIYDFSFISKINPGKEVILIVDDSHGIGVLNEGSSVLKSVPQTDHVQVLLVASMAKALGVDAGLILGPQRLIEELKQTDEFIGASPSSAAGLYAFMHAGDIYGQSYEQLMLLNKEVSLFLETSNWHFAKDFPVFLYKGEDLEKKLLKNNILVSSFPYPTTSSPVINRIIICSWHSKQQIEQLKSALKS
ncbi:aminotransferase class I/II-fold pyridoxal phosphate-dependent enzyme [Pedobacter montanisoli]|uniref:Aminotransferase class I/II-fold pyridoxal phosphate-dependent enzyme n=1 Tax=Pedobacter montanisoli TaxID=2923277 RepID=A0ABS9ZT31_9SPHI|nr:aminotransferase class I/II-fold pyridoxal phosphate-dependent enzyme [Pedobacter montanisoli]MCJ0741755.1 aminotransferase class I/II-fold pyridoxal phosphate-dependent enzyme [Pedobacter montanisoli]